MAKGSTKTMGGKMSGKAAAPKAGRAVKLSPSAPMGTGMTNANAMGVGTPAMPATGAGRSVRRGRGSGGAGAGGLGGL